MDEDTIPFRKDFSEGMCETSRGKSAGYSRRQPTSHVDFRVNPEIERIRENENSRRKHRIKCQHCASCHCQQRSSENRSLERTRKNDHFRRSNVEIPEAMLSQHIEHAESSRNAIIFSKNNRGQQRSQSHRPGASPSHGQNRNNSLNYGLGRNSEKYENRCRCEGYPRQGQSPLREFANPNAATEETDYRVPYERTYAAAPCRPADLCWRPMSGEVHSEPETDPPSKNRRNDDRHPADTKNRRVVRAKSPDGNNGPEEEQEEEEDEDDEDEDDGKPLLETGSSVAKDEDWQQYEKDQRELKDLGEDLRQFVRRKMSSSQVAEEKSKRAEEADTLEKIHRFVSKLPVPRTKCSDPSSSKTSKKRDASPNERRRTWSSRIDADRKTRQSDGIDEYSRHESNKDRELGRKLADRLLDIHLENPKPGDGQETEDEEEDEEGEENAAGSETEEEARQLLQDKTDTEILTRKLKKSWSRWKREASRNLERDKRAASPREKRKREKSEISSREVDICPSPGRENYRADPTTARGDESRGRPGETLDFRKSRTHGRDENTEMDEAREKMYERANSALLDLSRKNCAGAPRDCCKADIELPRSVSKTRTRIDEMIDDGLSREAQLLNRGVLSVTKKDPARDQEDETSRRVSPKNPATTNEPCRKIREEGYRHTRAREIFSRAARIEGGCFCRRLAKILADDPSSRDCVRKLKHRRWNYLDGMKSLLAKLYDLERFLDTCSPDMEPSFSKSEIETDEREESKANPEKSMKDRFG